MIVYLADQYKNKETVKARREELKELGIKVNSRWLEEKYSANATLKDLKNEQEVYARYDIEDIEKADVFVLFAVDPSKATLRGGRHFETGFAYGIGVPILVVGPKENVFHYLSQIRQVDTWTEAITLLIKVAKMTQGSSDTTFYQRALLKS